MLVRALDFDGLVADPTWVYRWRDHEWGAKGVAHFYGPDHPVGSCRIVMRHILERLGIEPGLRDAWCEFQGDDLVVHEFRGRWPRSMPEAYRDRRVVEVRVREMWTLGLTAEGSGLVGIA